MKITIRNIFHNTKVKTEIKDNIFFISGYALKKLCGIKDCSCDMRQFFIDGKRVNVNYLDDVNVQVVEREIFLV